ncbi:NADPH-dependent F420 reductase [Cohnella massiliensis]|uniref:NADPH-dependent F420 reductase n=1 Tax=Cohnella massiliensis TaxID=1816691 RepID=UPI0015949F4D|nr:NAD(P)-binding domain-containing protein [Cohnella massiliensis]
MKIGILGAGRVGKTIGEGLIRAGHEVRIGSRDPEHAKHREWKREAGGKGDVVSLNEAARFGDPVFAALPWDGLKEALERLEPGVLKNKTVVDVTNAVRFEDGPRLMYGDTSAGELVQRWLPDSSVVKTLNTVSDSRMVHPSFRDGMPAMFVSGNDARAKNQVKSLLEDLGWRDMIDLGDIRQSRLQEALMLACVISEIRLGSPGMAFALLRG